MAQNDAHSRENVLCFRSTADEPFRSVRLLAAVNVIPPLATSHEMLITLKL
jgi:hypothetical protein